jgi:hypothetical protein
VSPDTFAEVFCGTCGFCSCSNFQFKVFVALVDSVVVVTFIVKVRCRAVFCI